MAGEGEPDDSVARNRQLRLRLGIQANHSTPPRQGSGHVNVPARVERQSLRAAEAAIKRSHFPGGRDSVEVVVTGGGRPGDKKLARSAEGQVIRRHTRFHGREYKNLFVAINFENRPAAVADVKVFIRVERNARGDAHTFRIERAVAVRVHEVDGSFHSAGNVQEAFTVHC